MKKLHLLIFLSVFLQLTVLGQSCDPNSYNCSIFSASQYPASTFSTSSSAWQNVSTFMNAGNYTAFNVTCGNTYEWSYCSDFGGYENFNAELTLFDQSFNFLCYQNNSNRGNCPNAPYLSWPATFTGTVYLLTTSSTTAHCQPNSGSAYYSSLMWRQSISGPPCGCTNWQINPSNVPVAASGGSGSVSVSASGTCTYNVPINPCSWVTLSASNGVINYSIQSNCGPAQSCTVNITSNGTTVASFTINQAGTTPPSTPSITANPTSICTGQTSNLSINNACSGCNYQWSSGCNPQTGTSTSVTSPGAYSVTASDNCGNTATATLTIAQSTQSFSPQLNANPASICPTGQTSTISVTNASSCTNCTYQWSGGTQSTSSTVVNTPNNYSVTVTNACSQTSTASINVSSSNFNLQTPQLSANPNAVCANQTSTVTVTNSTAYAGCASCTYTWSGGVSAGSNTQRTVTGPGTYSLTITNSCNQSVVGQVTINNSATAPVTPTIQSNPASFCSGTANLQVTNTSSCNQCTYAWSSGCNPQTGANTTITTAGTYTVTVTNSCNLSTAGSITVNSNPTATISPSNPKFCFGGSIQLTATTGSAYSWSNGQTTQSITANTIGNYSVTVTNPGSCAGSASASVTVSQYPSPIANAGSDQTAAIASNVTIGGNPTASAGTSPYSYNWSGNVSNPTDHNPTIIVSDSGTYCVTVTDANSCSAKDCMHIDTGSCGTNSIDHSTSQFGPQGGIDSVHVTGQGGCAWTATSSQSWITIISGQNGSGNNPLVRYSVQACVDNNNRAAAITIAGQQLTINQQCQCNPPTVVVHEDGKRLWADNVPGATYQWQYFGQNISGAISRFYNDSITGPGVYTVIVCIGSCCTQQDYTTGLEELGALKYLSIYPNPANDHLTIEGNNLGSGVMTIAIHDLVGKSMAKDKVIVTGGIKAIIDVSKLNSGIYELELMLNGSRIVRKVTIQK